MTKILNLLFAFSLALTALSSQEAYAAKVKRKVNREVVVNQRYASLVINSDNGEILFQENASKSRYPASLTKMMTIYLTFAALQSGKLDFDQILEVSPHAASRPRMNMGLMAGDEITVRDAINCAIVRSANDAAVILAEAIAGSESKFAARMTKVAHQLGMHHTTFRNSSGLHHPQQKTTAYDMAKLAIALKRDFPEYYRLFAKTSFSYRGNVYKGHNNVLANYPGATGLKTGFVNASGFNLVTSAKRGNIRLVGVVLGGNSAKARDKRMMSLLDKYFTTVETLNKEEKLEVRSSKLKKLGQAKG